MGTSNFSVPVLKALIDSEYELIAVVTQPDRPKGRGQVVQAPPVKKVALQTGLRVLQPEKTGQLELIQEFRGLRLDMMVVVAYGQILNRELLDVPKRFCMNLHASLLPKYRGAAPINWPIINGDRETGVTTMRMDTGLDTGDILLKKTVPIRDEDDSQIIHDKLSIEGANLVLETIAGLTQGTLSPEPQNHPEATHAPKLTKELGFIRWDQSSSKIRNQIRGLRPWPGAYTFMTGKKLEIIKAKTSSSQNGEEPGVVLRVSDYGIEIGTGEGRLIVTELKLEGRRAMPVKNFLQGRLVEPGFRFDNWNGDGSVT